MELAFERKELRTACEDEDEAIRLYGKRVTESLKHRLADMRAAVTASDLLVGNLRTADQGSSGEMIIDLADGHRILFVPNHRKSCLNEDGAPDLHKISRVRILDIGAIGNEC